MFSRLFVHPTVTLLARARPMGGLGFLCDRLRHCQASGSSRQTVATNIVRATVQEREGGRSPRFSEYQQLWFDHRLNLVLLTNTIQ